MTTDAQGRYSFTLRVGPVLPDAGLQIDIVKPDAGIHLVSLTRPVTQIKPFWQDGVVTPDEALELRVSNITTARFALMDANDDGQVDRAERAAFDAADQTVLRQTARTLAGIVKAVFDDPSLMPEGVADTLALVQGFDGDGADPAGELAARAAFLEAHQAAVTAAIQQMRDDPLLAPQLALYGNNVPSAADDLFTAGEETPLNMPTPGVLGNDSDADGDALVTILLSAPGSGTLVFNPDGSFTYTPQVGFQGADSFTYAVSDGLGQSGPAKVTIVVVNVAPTLVSTTLDRTQIDEGQSVHLSGSFTDPGSLDTHIVTVAWADGTLSAATVDPTSRTFTAAHTYLDDSLAGYAISVTVRDNDGGTTTGSAGTVTVKNAPPVVTVLVATPQTVTENGVVSVTGAFTDPGILDTHTVMVAWGDGTMSPAVVDQTARTFSASHRYLDDDPTGTPADTVTVTVVVTDKDGGAAQADTPVTVQNAPPVIALLSLSDHEILENGDLTVTGIFFDPGTLDTHTVLITWGDGTVSAATVNQSARTFTATHRYLDDTPSGTPSDPYTITAVVTDDDGGTAQASSQVTVDNVAPVLVSFTTGAAAVNEGSSLSVTGSFTDVGTLDTHTAVILWGDGTSSLAAVDPVTRTFSASHIYLDDNPTGTPADTYVLSASVTDDDGGVSGSLTAPVTVRNVAPDFTSLTNTAAVPGNVLPGSPVTLTGAFTDPGADTFTVLVNWGDGSAPGTFSLAVGIRDFSFDHLYAQPNIYTISVSLADDDGGTDQGSTQAFLSGVVLRNGVLYIIGTGNNDTAQVRESSGTVSVFTTFPQAPQTKTFASGDVKSIAVYMGAGDDTLSFSLATQPVRDVAVFDPDSLTLAGLKAHKDSISLTVGGALTVSDTLDADHVTLSAGSVRTTGSAVIEAEDLEMTAVSSIIVTTDADQITAVAPDVTITQDHDLYANVTATNLTVTSSDDVTLQTRVGTLTISAPSATITEADSLTIKSTLGSLTLSTLGTGDVNVTETNDLTLDGIAIADGAFTVTAAGTLTAQSVKADLVSLTATRGDIRVDFIDAGPVGTVVLNASRSIFETDSHGPASDLVAHSAVLTAGNAISGGGNRDLDLEITVDQLTATASRGDIRLSETDDIEILAASAVDHEIVISAGGAITGSGVTADTLTVTAVTGIHLGTRVAHADLVTTGNGPIFLADADGLVVDHAAACNGPLTLTAAGSLQVVDASIQTDAAANTITLVTTNGGSISIGSMVVGRNLSGFVIVSAGSVLESTPTDCGADLVGNFADITAAGDLGSATDSSRNLELDLAHLRFNGVNLRASAVRAMDLNVVASGLVSLSSSADLTALSVVTAGGSVTLTSDGSIKVGYIDAGPAGTVTLNACGAIVEADNPDAASDLVAGTARLTANGNIGGGTTRSLDLEITVGSLYAASSCGSIGLNETDDINLASVTTSGHDIIISAGGTISVTGVLSTGTCGGSIQLTSTGGQIVTAASNSNRITTSTLTLAATGTGATAITVSTAVQTLTARITSGPGSIVVDEQDSVTLALVTVYNGSIRVTAGGTITAADVESLTDRSGDTVTLVSMSGDVLVGYVSAGSVGGSHRFGQVSIYSARDIKEATPYDSAVDLRAHLSLLYAMGRIGGSGGADIELDVDMSNAFTGGADLVMSVQGDIELSYMGNRKVSVTATGTITALSVVTSGKDIYLSSTGGDLILGYLSTGRSSGRVTLTAYGSILMAQPTAGSARGITSAGDITITATTGAVALFGTYSSGDDFAVTAARNVSIDASVAASDTLDVTSSGAGVTLKGTYSSGGDMDIQAKENILFDATASSKKTVRVNSTNGSVVLHGKLTAEKDIVITTGPGYVNDAAVSSHHGKVKVTTHP